MLERDVERLDALAGQHRPHRLDGGAHHQRTIGAGRRQRVPHTQRGRFQVQRVLLGLEQQRVHAALDQRVGLERVGGAHVVEGHVAGDGDRAGARSHRPDDEALTSGLAGDAGPGQCDLVGAFAEAVLGEHVGRAPEGVGADQVGAGVPVGAVDAGHHVGAREVQVLVAALVLRAAEVRGREVGRLQHRTHRPVEDEDAFQQGLPQPAHASMVPRPGVWVFRH